MQIECFVLWHYCGQDGQVTRASSTTFRGNIRQLQECLVVDVFGKPHLNDQAPYVIPVQVIRLPESFECLIRWRESDGTGSVSWFGGNMRSLQEWLDKRQKEQPGMVPLQIIRLPIPGWAPK